MNQSSPNVSLLYDPEQLRGGNRHSRNFNQLKQNDYVDSRTL